MEASTQHDYAIALIEQFDSDGHEHDITDLDLLDALASLGLELHPGTAALVEYHQVVSGA
jgi:hypothetical protein